MAKMFYSAAEAAKKLGKSEADLKDLVRAGKLREFRDAGTVNYKTQDVDALVGKVGASSAPSKSDSAASASASGEIVLEPVDDSGIELAPSSSDVLKLEDADSDETGLAMLSAKKKKEGSAIASVGVNVFEDDELDEVVDPLAQTAVTDVAGLGIEGVGSGSGILDLTRESDDTSLGAELLEEIYTGEEATSGTAEMGDDTRAGLDAAISPDEETAGDEQTATVGAVPGNRRVVTKVVEFAPDAFSAGLTAAMVVAVVVLGFGGLAGASLVRGVMPSLLETIYSNLMMFTGGAVLAAAIAAVVAFFLSKRSG